MCPYLIKVVNFLVAIPWVNETQKVLLNFVDVSSLLLVYLYISSIVCSQSFTNQVILPFCSDYLITTIKNMFVPIFLFRTYEAQESKNRKEKPRSYLSASRGSDF